MNNTLKGLPVHILLRKSSCSLFSLQAEVLSNLVASYLVLAASGHKLDPEKPPELSPADLQVPWHSQTQLDQNWDGISDWKAVPNKVFLRIGLLLALVLFHALSSCLVLVVALNYCTVLYVYAILDGVQ